MKDFIIDLNYIPSETINNNTSYYKKHNIIPINSIYKLYTQNYFKNSPHIFRDFYDDTDFTQLLNNRFTLKPISHKEYNMGKFYIPSSKNSNVINTEIIPVKVDKYNIINFGYKIKEIYTFNNDIDTGLFKTLFFYHNKINGKKNIKELLFIADDINISSDFKIIKWIPINNFSVTYTDYYEIDISNFINNNTKDIMILCSKI